MSGPCSYPAGDKAEWESHNELVCDLHMNAGRNNCTPDWPVQGYSKKIGYYDIEHVFVTRRVWLGKRGKLRTGKTV